MRCDEVPDRLLERRYGLLDPAEAADLDAHLVGCPTCTAAQAETDKTARLLATAAKLPFPGVKFVPPLDATPARPAARPRPSWTSWTVAAGLLFAVGGGVGVPTVQSFLGFRAAQERADRAVALQTEADRQRAEAQKKADDAKAEHDAAAKAWVDQQAQKLNRPVRIEVSGPTAAAPGGSNVYAIRTSDPSGKLIATGVTVAVRDRAGNEYLIEDFQPIESEGKADPKPHRFKLPPDLWAKLPPGAGDLFLSVTAVVPKTGAKVELAEPVKLTAPAFGTFLVTDKPLYRPGETVFFRSVTLDRTKLLPPADDRVLRVVLKKPDGQPLDTVTARDRPVDAAGNPVAGPDGKPVRGVACGAFRLPAELPGGEYKLEAFELPAGWDKPDLPPNLAPVAVRKLAVNNYQADKLLKTLEFDARSYGRGDPVKATLTVTDQGKPVVGANVVPLLTVQPPDLIDIRPLKTDAAGKAVITFVLPNRPDLADVTLSAEVRKDGVVETIQRRVPLVTGNVKVEFFPEGGDLIAGMPTRVYVRVSTPTGRPADLIGAVTDGTNTVAQVRTLTDADRPGANQGLGVFSFTPAAGKTYTLKPTVPNGAATVPLPPAKPTGVGLSVPGGVFDPAAPLPVRVHSAGKKRELVIGAYTRGALLGHRKLTVDANGTAETTIPPPADAPGGVTRVTVFEVEPGGLKPAAERLVFRRPPTGLSLAVTANVAGAARPGDELQLGVSARDESGRPAAAVLWVAVVNESVLTLADDRTERALPTHFLLAAEVRKPEQLEHADFFLTDHPKAAAALDLLLGTQGWRRFAEQRTVTQVSPAVNRTDVESLLISAGAAPGPLTRTPADAELRAKYTAAAAKLAAAEAELKAVPPAGRTDAVSAARRAAFDAAAPLRTLSLCAAAVGLAGLGLLVFGPRVWRIAGGGLLLIAIAGLVLAVPAWAVAPELLFENVTTDAALAPQAGAAPPRPEAFAERPTTAPLTGDIREALLGARRPQSFSLAPRPDARQDTRPTPHALPTELADRLAADLKRPAAEQALADAHARRVEEAYRQGKPRLSPLEREGLDAVKSALAGPGPFVAREYAHVRPAPPPDDPTRTDFAETVLWHPLLVLPADGSAQLRFQLSDSLQSYRVLAAGHTLDGRLGSVSGRIAVRQPLAVDVKLPAEISTADRPRLPVIVSNATGTPADTTLGVWSDHLRFDEAAVSDRLAVPANGGDRRLIPFTPTKPGPARVRVSAAAGHGRVDAVERPVSVVPDGFPVSGAANETLETKAILKYAPPSEPVPGTLSAKLTVYTNALADVRSGLDGLLREPHGCFEQTSSANYPNVLVLDYLRQTGAAQPGVADRARELLERGQQRLVSFEVPKDRAAGREGFDWFGRFPPHPPLSAYGLVQFADAAKVTAVEPALISRTRDYLLACRDGEGGFRRPADGHTFGNAPPAVCNAYIVWAVTEADPAADVAKEVSAAAAEAAKSNDPYRLALAALASLNRKGNADDLLAKLAAKQGETGGVTGAETSITRSAGADLDTETTALAALAFLKSGKHEGNARSAVKWLAGRRGPHGAFGATQATVLALRALTAFARQNRRPDEAGTVTVGVNGKEVAARPFRTTDPEPVTIELPAEVLGEAAEVTVTTDAKAAYPVSLTWAGWSRRPPSDPGCPLTLTTSLDKAEYAEGAVARLSVALTNTATTDQGMAVAIVGLPAGLEPPADLKQLRELADAGTIAHFERSGRELVFYWRGLGPKQAVPLTVDLVAAVPGEYRGPAGRAYLYYSPAAKHWVPPLAASVR